MAFPSRIATDDSLRHARPVPSTPNPSKKTMPPMRTLLDDPKSCGGSFRFPILPTILIVGASILGCGRGPTTGTVRGKVTLDGKPLAVGIARFVPEDGAGATADCAVKEGNFELKLPTGKKIVTFSAPKVTGRQKMYDTPDSPEVDVVGELLPPRYNDTSELRLEVTAGAQDATFALLSK